MDAQLAYLATNSATALIQAITTDGWEAAKRGLAGLWRRWHPGKVTLIEAQVDDARERLTTASPEDIAEITRVLAATWSGNLSALLRTAPDAADDLQELVARNFIVVESNSQRIGDVTQEAHVDHGGISMQAGGNIITGNA
jgi:hypothetical protein